MNRDTAKHLSELFAFLVVLGLFVAMSVFVQPIVLILVIANLVAGSIITDRNQVYVPLTNEIQANRVSLVWGFRKLWRNNFWWMH